MDLEKAENSRLAFRLDTELSNLSTASTLSEDIAPQAAVMPAPKVFDAASINEV